MDDFFLHSNLDGNVMDVINKPIKRVNFLIRLRIRFICFGIFGSLDLFFHIFCCCYCRSYDCRVGYSISTTFTAATQVSCFFVWQIMKVLFWQGWGSVLLGLSLCLRGNHAVVFYCRLYGAGEVGIQENRKWFIMFCHSKSMIIYQTFIRTHKCTKKHIQTHTHPFSPYVYVYHIHGIFGSTLFLFSIQILWFATFSNRDVSNKFIVI